MCLPLLIFPCTIKPRSSLLAQAHLGGPGKKGHKTVVLMIIHLYLYHNSPLIPMRHLFFTARNMLQWCFVCFVQFLAFDSLIKINALLYLEILHTTTISWPFFRNHPGVPVPEENLWTLWCKEKLTEADTPTIPLGATPSGLTSAQFHHPPFFTGRIPFLPSNQQCQSTVGN